jgi:hypothetical protein
LYGIKIFNNLIEEFMNNIRTRYLYFEKLTEKEFLIVLSNLEFLGKTIFRFKKTIFLATFFVLNNFLKVIFGLIGLLFVEPTLYKNEEPNKEAKKIELTKNTWRVL